MYPIKSIVKIKYVYSWWRGSAAISPLRSDSSSFWRLCSWGSELRTCAWSPRSGSPILPWAGLCALGAISFPPLASGGAGPRLPVSWIFLVLLQLEAFRCCQPWGRMGYNSCFGESTLILIANHRRQARWSLIRRILGSGSPFDHVGWRSGRDDGVHLRSSALDHLWRLGRRGCCDEQQSQSLGRVRHHLPCDELRMATPTALFHHHENTWRTSGQALICCPTSACFLVASWEHLLCFACCWSFLA